MSLKNHTTVKWTKFGEAEWDRGWLRKEQLKDIGNDNFSTWELLLCFTVILKKFFSVCYFAKENSIYRWLLLKYKI